MLKFILGLLEITGKWLITAFLCGLIAFVVSEVSTYVFVRLHDLIGSTAFIIISLCGFVFGFYYLFFGAVKSFNWNVENRFIKYIWNKHGATLLIAMVISITAFLIALVSVMIDAVCSSPNLLMIVGAGLFVFIFAIGYFADKHYKV